MSIKKSMPPKRAAAIIANLKGQGATVVRIGHSYSVHKTGYAQVKLGPGFHLVQKKAKAQVAAAGLTWPTAL